MTCIMSISIYTCWVRFKNTLTGMSRWLKTIPESERSRLLNKHQYRINVYAKVDALMCEMDSYCPTWVEVLWVKGKVSLLERSFKRSMGRHFYNIIFFFWHQKYYKNTSLISWSARQIQTHMYRIIWGASEVKTPSSKGVIYIKIKIKKGYLT